MNFRISRNTIKMKATRTSLSDTQLLVCDIDGTLTADGTIYPSAYTLSTIEALHEKGIAFGLASGRSVDQLRSLKEEWGLSFDFDMVIGLNGSEYYDLINDTKHVLYELSTRDVKDIIEGMLGRFPDLNVSIYADGCRLLRFEDEMAVLSRKRTGMENKIVDDISQMWEKPCTKVMFRVSEEVMARIEPYALSLTNERFRPCKTQTTMLEFMHASANKGAALLKYCEGSDTDISKVVAFGDMDNDNELLKEAGFGVCMCNGADQTKACADDVSFLSNNEDGCAAYINRYILEL